ncbi:DUF2777 family protein [Alkalihalophilus sp. As8PL]|uniref:DUF2777 family protein n=1 Tax=Alkalihalophilus sp. As8PL TaxID=3237103 RepID=A0AB39BTW1_9BACI
MDRKQAQQNLNQLVIINENLGSLFVGKLLEVITLPNKPWRGKVEIKYVMNVGENLDQAGVIVPPAYKDGDKIEFPGNKLSPLPSSFNMPKSFDHSHANAIAANLTDIFEQQKQLLIKENQYLAYLKQEKLDHLLNRQNSKEKSYISYAFYQSGSRYLLIDEQETTLDLADCPFEFRWLNKKKEVLGYYAGDGIFTSHTGEEYRPTEGDTIFIDKEQFEPYFILRNELEPSSLELLESNLIEYQLTHRDLIDCHNSLLLQLLQSTGQQSFKGVNFLMYRSKAGHVMVQHHYERTLTEQESDHVFDRFEFTSDTGKRSVATYISNMTNKPT